MDTLILTADDVHSVARYVGLDALMDALMDRLTAAFAVYRPEDTPIPMRKGFAYHRPAPGLIEWMPCMGREEQVTIKVVGYHPTNAARHNLPTILSTVSAYDPATGHLMCMMDGTLLTALRTGAASAIASRLLAAPHTETVGLIGAGAQAVTQLHALTRVLDLRHVLVYDTDPAVQATFVARMRSFADSLTIEAAPPETIVRRADVICTATSVEIGCGPVFADTTPQPWAHFNAVGSDFPGKVEVPVALLRRSLVCPDFREQALHEGECQQLPAEAIGPSLYELVQQPEAYRFAQDELTVFDSTGWALEDHVAMGLFIEYATDLGLGTRLAVEAIPDDPHDPYQLAAAVAASVS